MPHALSLRVRVARVYTVGGHYQEGYEVWLEHYPRWRRKWCDLASIADGYLTRAGAERAGRMWAKRHNFHFVEEAP